MGVSQVYALTFNVAQMSERGQSDACLRFDLLFYQILIYIFNVTTKYCLIKIRSDSYHRPTRCVNRHTIEFLVTKYLTIVD